MSKSNHSVQLFVTCLVDSLFPEVGIAVVEVLNSSGVEVQFPKDQTCCGQPAYNAGYQHDAKKMAKHTIELLESTEGPIVIPSGSCAAMIRHGYAELFREEPEWHSRAASLAERAFEFSEFVADECATFEPKSSRSGALAYHPSCHLQRGLGIEKQPLSLLNRLDVEVFALEAECCGFGGFFAIEHPEISGEILRRKLNEVHEAGASTVVGCDVSCLMQIEGGLRKQDTEIRCAHLAQVLAGHEPGLR